MAAHQMKVTHRPATPEDAKPLFEIRRKSILVLAPEGMPVVLAEMWAANLTVAGMRRKIRAMEIWIAERNGTAIGWGAIQDDRLEGLYTDPEFAGRGIGTQLLGLLEGLLRQRGVVTVRADASANAESFYLRRGYDPAGDQTPEGARPIAKRLLVE
jgi:putative acetyltransferase